MNTFGPINWREFYGISNRHRVEEEPTVRQEVKLDDLPITPSPCDKCPRNEGYGCHKSIIPSDKTSCEKWEAWCSEAWHIVTSAIRGTGR